VLEKRKREEGEEKLHEEKKMIREMEIKAEQKLKQVMFEKEKK
jgi:hypothetical protein